MPLLDNVVRLVILGMLVSAFVMAIVALCLLPQSHSGKPTVFGSVVGGNLRLASNSSNYAGTVLGSASNGAETINVRFSRRYRVVPKAVLISPYVGTGYTLTDQLRVSQVTVDGFTVTGTSTASGDFTLFSYVVVA